MRPSTYAPISTSTVTPTSTSDVKTLTPPAGTSGFLITVETNNARVTLDGTDPSGGTGSHVYPKDTAPQLVLLGAQGMVVKCVSTAAANSVVNVTWLQ